MNKVRSDIYFLLLARVQRRLALFTEQDMYARWVKEVEIGRVPSSIEFVHVAIPEDLNLKLRVSCQEASREVTPG